jgi:CRISPR-associated protein Csa3
MRENSQIESTFIKEVPTSTDGGEDMGSKVLIATVYNVEPVMLSVTKIGPERLILLVDTDADKVQKASLELIKKSLGSVLDIKVIKIDVYNIVEIARKCVEIIDMQPTADSIFVNVTSGRKPQAIGLLFACYARHVRVKKIMYLPEEKGRDVVYLPKLSFKLTESQKEILEQLENGTYNTIPELAKVVELSQGMLYRAIDELKDMDLITTDDGIKLTDAGKIARL